MTTMINNTIKNMATFASSSKWSNDCVINFDKGLKQLKECNRYKLT